MAVSPKELHHLFIETVDKVEKQIDYKLKGQKRYQNSYTICINESLSPEMVAELRSRFLHVGWGKLTYKEASNQRDSNSIILDTNAVVSSSQIDTLNIGSHSYWDNR
jgi:hypothetical protein